MTSESMGSDRLPLSFAQQQLWFLHQLTSGTTIYNMHMGYRLRGRLDIPVLRRALTVLLDRHDVLRSTFHSADGEPYQLVSPPAEAPLTLVDRTGLGPQQRTAAVEQEISTAATAMFDLVSGPLTRFTVVRLAEDDFALSLDFHHIVTDGWSMGLFNSELATTYAALLAGTEPELPELEVVHRDFVLDQRTQDRADERADDLDFWAERLNELPVLELPTDRARPLVSSLEGDAVVLDFDPELVRALHAYTEERGVSLFMVLTAALDVVLMRYSGQEDIPVGVPMLGRTDPDLESVIGLFVNMVVLRTDLSGDPTFGELVDRITEGALDLHDHQDTPFEKIVERLQPVREPGRNPLFQTSIQVLNASNSGTGFALPGVEVEWLAAETTRAMFDLNLNLFEVGASLRAHLSYATDLFDGWRMHNLLGHMHEVLRAGVADPALRLSRIPLFTDAERRQILDAGRGDEVPAPLEPVHVAVARRAMATPEALAAVGKGVELTYGELDRRAALLARRIRAAGVGHEQIVGIAMDRDLDTLVAMLAVWKAGAAFTMLDPRHPAVRLEYMLTDTASPMLITHSEFAAELPSGAWQTLALDTEWAAIEDAPDADGDEWAEIATRDSLAYVLYTSGSTGRPKGVLIEHRALHCFLQAYQRTFDFGPGDRLLQLPALTFDMSEGEIWTALTCGAALVLVSHEEGQSPEALGALIRSGRVTYAGLSPAMLSLVEAGPYPDLKYVMGGADALPAELVNKWNLPGRTFVNLYGPTEAAVACTEYPCEHVEWRSSPPIGRPELNRQVYVVDAKNNLVPRGVPGELLIGGSEGLARGYLHQPELTAEKFVEDPFLPGQTVYRSGDLVRWSDRWQIDFLGRIDDQVKLRGLRIELGEVESVLLTHPEVRMAVVKLAVDPVGDKQLVGYLTSKGDTPPDLDDVRRHLSVVLPEHMVPTAWVTLERFPLTAARKIDRKALPHPDFAVAGVGVVEPSTPTEKAVAKIFATVLAVEQVGAEANFFELSGSSLQAMRVVSRINKAFGVKVNVRLFYGSSSVSAIATTIDEMVAAKEAKAARS